MVTAVFCTHDLREAGHFDVPPQVHAIRDEKSLEKRLARTHTQNQMQLARPAFLCLRLLLAAPAQAYYRDDFLLSDRNPTQDRQRSIEARRPEVLPRVVSTGYSFVEWCEYRPGYMVH